MHIPKQLTYSEYTYQAADLFRMHIPKQLTYSECTYQSS